MCYIIVHVDDILSAATNLQFMDGIFDKLKVFFEITDLGFAKLFLGIDICRSQNGTFRLSQRHYIEKIADEFSLSDEKGQKYPLDPGYYKLKDDNYLPDNGLYRKLIGMLLYVSMNSRPDVAASVCILAQRVEKLRELDLSEAKRVVKYILATKDLCLHLDANNSQCVLRSFSDSNWAEDTVDRKSNSVENKVWWLLLQPKLNFMHWQN